MKDYNGFSGKERLAGDKILKKAIAEGKLPSLKVAVCVKCGQDKGIRHYHTEDYSPEGIVAHSECWCWTCHMLWHSRFRFPVEVHEYFEKIKAGARYSPVYVHDFKILEKYGVKRD